jgi:hypothetical protein
MNDSQMKQLAFLVAACFIAVATLLFGQTAKKAAPGRLPEKPDTWQRSKECATQAEKMIAARDLRSVSFGGPRVASWTNHYSPKYSRCFVSVSYFDGATPPPKGMPWLSSTILIDAFERSTVASTATDLAPPAEIACGDQQEPAECDAMREAMRESVRIMWQTFCNIEKEPTDCAKAKEFIEDHMRN